MNGKRQNTGFTLIELSGVMVIIALLGAILFPVFAEARGKARQATCLSNLKTIGHGALDVLAGLRPNNRCVVVVWLSRGSFSWYVQPYLRNYAILHCPAFSASAEAYGRYCNANYLPGNIDNPTGESQMWGYGYNTGHQWANDTGLTQNAPYQLTGTYKLILDGRELTARYRDTPLLGIPVSKIIAPSRTLLIGDSSDTVVSGLGRFYLRRPTAQDDACDRLRRFNWPRHNQGNNAVYADGHAGWYRYNDTILADGDPAVVPDVCTYFHDYDGINSPGNCKNGL